MKLICLIDSLEFQFNLAFLAILYGGQLVKFPNFLKIEFHSKQSRKVDSFLNMLTFLCVASQLVRFKFGLLPQNDSFYLMTDTSCLINNEKPFILRSFDLSFS